MSLQIWLPLNGSLENKGVNNIKPQAVGTALATSDGKITTNSYKWTADGQAISLPNFMNTFKNYTKYTLCAWIKFTGPATNHSSVICSSGDWNSPAAQLCFGLNSYSNGYSNILIPNGTSWSSCVVSANKLVPNTWYHIAATYDGTKTYVYLDGNLIGTYNGGGITSTSNNANLYIGCATYYTGFTLKGNLNDFRIYNNYSSAKEIKEISKGLVAHYPLNNNGQGGINLLTASKGDITSTEYMIKQYIPTKPMEVGKQYTLTVCFTPGSDFQYFNPHIMQGSYGGTFPNIVSDGTANRQIVSVVTNSGWSYNSGKTPADNAANANICMYHKPNNSTCTIHWVTLQEGTKPVYNWNPSNSESVYGTTEYDCSGFENHGTRSGNFTSYLNSARNSSCLNFTGSECIVCGRGPMVKDSITISCWGYMNNWSEYSGLRMISCTESGGWNLEPSGDSSANGMCFAIGTGTTSNTYLTAVSSTKITALSSGWHHFVGTYDGYVAKIYIDGVHEGTSSTKSAKTPIFYNTSNSIFIGAEAGSSITTPAAGYFKGKISDVRIYGTALSLEHITDLYNTPIWIDKNGKIGASEYIETEKVNKVRYHKAGIIEASTINESEGIYPMKFKVLNDGSAWARVNWLNLTTTKEVFANATEVAECTSKVNRFSLMSQIDKFRGFLKLPKDFTQIDYIESTGTQYIDTGYYWTKENVKIIMDANVISNSGSQSLFGNEEPFSGGRYFSIVPHGTNGSYAFCVGSSSGIASAVTGIGSRFTMECETTTTKKLTVKINGTTSFTKDYSGTVMGYANTTSTHASKGKIYIFANHNSGSNGANGIQIISGMRLYNFKMYDGEVLVRNFIPCKNASGTVGLYDLVTGVFYGNAGTGSFTAGANSKKDFEQNEADGIFEFMLTYPSMSNKNLYNRWRQSISPNTASATTLDGTGYYAVHTDFTKYAAPIRKTASTNAGSAVYSCNISGNWWAPIGQLTLYSSTGIPAADGSTQTETELWVRIDNLPEATKFKLYNNKYVVATEILEI